MIAARADASASAVVGTPSTAAGLHAAAATGGGGSSVSSGTVPGGGSREAPGATASGDGTILRTARPEDVGVVYRVVVTTPNDGFCLVSHGISNLHSGAPLRLAALQRRFLSTAEPPTSITIRITCASLREVRVGDFSVGWTRQRVFYRYGPPEARVCPCRAPFPTDHAMPVTKLCV